MVCYTVALEFYFQTFLFDRIEKNLQSEKAQKTGFFLYK